MTLTNSEKKLVIVCKTLPPLVIGSTVLMANLFGTYKGSIEAIAGWEYGAKSDSEFKAPFKTHYLKFFPSIIQRILERYSNFYFPIIKWYIYLKLKIIKPSAVFAACTPDGLFFTASYIMCQKLNIPFWGHMHDLWLENTKEGLFKRKLAKKWEPVIFKNADKIFCMTEHQMAYYQNKYPRSYELIPHCVREINTTSERVTKRIIEKGKRTEKTILYTGNISSAMNLNAVQFFVSCIDLLPANYKVKLLCSFSEETCKKMDLYHPRIEYAWVSVNEARKMVENVDLLFLPLSFKECSTKEVQTVFATKTLDYLTSGTPILVFSPSDSFHSWSASTNGWGYVVDQEDSALLIKSIITVLSDENLQNNLVTAALKEAQNRAASYYSDGLLQSIYDKSTNVSMR
jgi:hypothetical protein